MPTLLVGDTLDPYTGIFKWTPSAVQAGTIEDFILSVSDYRGGYDTIEWYVYVLPGDRPPVFTTKPPVAAALNRAWQYDAKATDPDGDVVTYSLDPQNTPAGMTINSTTGVLNWDPSTAGTYRVSIIASDGRGGTATQTFDLAVIANDIPPTITSTPGVNAAENSPFQYQLAVTDPDGNVAHLHHPPGTRGRIYRSSDRSPHMDPNFFRAWPPTILHPG